MSIHHHSTLQAGRKEGKGRTVKGRGANIQHKESQKWLTAREQVGRQGWMERSRVRWKGERRGELVYPWQLVYPIKADWLVNEAREARVLVPTGLFSAHSLTPFLQRKTIKKRMSKRCTFYVLIIPTLCLSICYSLSSAVKKKKKRGLERKKKEKER